MIAAMALHGTPEEVLTTCVNTLCTGGDAEYPTQHIRMSLVGDDVDTDTRFKIKGMPFKLRKTTAAESYAWHELVPPWWLPDLIVCVAASSSEKTVFQFGDIAASFRHVGHIVLLLTGDASHAVDTFKARAADATRMSMQSHYELGVRVYPLIVTSAEDTAMVKFLFHSAVEVVLVANLEASGMI